MPLCLVPRFYKSQCPLVVFFPLMSIMSIPVSTDYFWFKSIFSEIKRATPVYFLGKFAWNIFFILLPRGDVFLDVKVCLLDTTEDATEEWILLSNLFC